LHPLRNVFNKIFWDKRENPADYVVTFVHRGAEGNVKTISASSIKDVGASWFTYLTGNNEETLIPFHRVVKVKNEKTGVIVWSLREVI
jgi:uncharacterized protein (UPF0248 family)